MRVQQCIGMNLMLSRASKCISWKQWFLCFISRETHVKLLCCSSKCPSQSFPISWKIPSQVFIQLATTTQVVKHELCNWVVGLWFKTGFWDMSSPAYLGTFFFQDLNYSLKLHLQSGMTKVPFFSNFSVEASPLGWLSWTCIRVIGAWINSYEQRPELVQGVSFMAHCWNSAKAKSDFVSPDGFKSSSALGTQGFEVILLAKSLAVISCLSFICWH